MIRKKQELLKKLSSLLKISFNQSGLVKLLSSAQKEHRLVEDKFSEMLCECECARNSVFPFKELNAFKYFEKNFFSILFLSIFKAVGIPEGRILKYGVILHALRIIITCTDNILDDENKGPVFLNAELDNPVLTTPCCLCLRIKSWARLYVRCRVMLKQQHVLKQRYLTVSAP